jgi:hypothetical protein
MPLREPKKQDQRSNKAMFACSQIPQPVDNWDLPFQVKHVLWMAKGIGHKEKQHRSHVKKCSQVRLRVRRPAMLGPKNTEDSGSHKVGIITVTNRTDGPNSLNGWPYRKCSYNLRPTTKSAGDGLDHKHSQISLQDVFLRQHQVPGSKTDSESMGPSQD